MTEEPTNNVYLIRIQVERTGLKRRRKNIPKSWDREKIVVASKEIDAFNKMCGLYANRKNRRYMITLKDCIVLAMGNNNEDKMEGGNDEIV